MEFSAPISAPYSERTLHGARKGMFSVRLGVVMAISFSFCSLFPLAM